MTVDRGGRMPTVVVLAGGRGERFGAATEARPKPLIEVGGRPLIAHVLDAYLRAGCVRFVIASGYLSGALHAYLRGELWSRAGPAPELAAESCAGRERVRVGAVQLDLVDTGEGTENGGRLRRLAPLLDETFVLTWADVLSDIDIGGMLRFHARHAPWVTVAAVRPPLPFGLLEIDGSGRVTGFNEKPPAAPLWVSSGVFVVERDALSYLESDAASWERDALPRIAADGRLAAFRHEGFWHPVDTPRDREALERMCREGAAPWTRAG